MVVDGGSRWEVGLEKELSDLGLLAFALCLPMKTSSFLALELCLSSLSWSWLSFEVLVVDFYTKWLMLLFFNWLRFLLNWLVPLSEAFLESLREAE